MNKILMKQFSIFHLLKKSFFPLVGSFIVFFVLKFLATYMNYLTKYKILFLSMLIFLSFSWWKDSTKEKYCGEHSKKSKMSFTMGMLLFILSEVCFFFGFFWSFFHKIFSPSEKILCWPPHKFNNMILDPFMLPLVKTMLLLMSGVTVTLAHQSVENHMHKKKFYFSLFITIFLGLFFIVCQSMEYTVKFFNVKSMIFGSIFFLLTGFHGFHVIVGVIFLVAGFFLNQTSSTNFVLSFSIWYWHFVDVVWLFLFSFIYWYSSF